MKFKKKTCVMLLWLVKTIMIKEEDTYVEIAHAYQIFRSLTLYYA